MYFPVGMAGVQGWQMALVVSCSPLGHDIPCLGCNDAISSGNLSSMDSGTFCIREKDNIDFFNHNRSRNFCPGCILQICGDDSFDRKYDGKSSIIFKI